MVNRLGGALGTTVLATVLDDRLAHGTPDSAYGTTFSWALGLSLLTLLPAAFFPSGRHSADQV